MDGLQNMKKTFHSNLSHFFIPTSDSGWLDRSLQNHIHVCLLRMDLSVG